jgi:hypothetical protein
MKIIKTLYVPLFLLVLLSPAFINLGSTQEPLPAMIVEPENTLMKPAGQSFEVDVYAYDAYWEFGSDVYAYQICMKWNLAVVDINDLVTFGDFMDAPRVGYWGHLTTDAAAGQKIVNVEDGSKFQSGYAVLIEDDSNSEENEVASKLGNQLTMKYDLANTYTITANGGAYPLPGLTPQINIYHELGRAILGQATMGPAPGAQGDGLLCTLSFTVLTEAETALDIDDPILGQTTYIINGIGEVLGDEASGASDPGNWQSELLKGSGHLIYPWAEDLNGDGTVDIFDLCSVALHFGETGSPGWIPADINEDGDVDVEDLTLVSLKYGIYAA